MNDEINYNKINFSHNINENIFPKYRNEIYSQNSFNNVYKNNINPNDLKEKFFNIKNITPKRNKSDNMNTKINMRYMNENYKVVNTEPDYNHISLGNRINHINPLSYKIKKIRNTLDVNDINNKKKYRFSNRQINPLDPKYQYDWQMTEINENRNIKHIDFSEIGNHPKPLYLYNNEKDGKGLNTYDIIGAQPGTKSHISKLEIKYGRQMNHSKEDIIGSHPGSLLRGIKTKRITNQLEPDYPLIGGKSLDYGHEKDNKHVYDYKSLLDYYTKYSKITNPENDKRTQKKEENKKEKYIKMDNYKYKNVPYGFGSDKKIYPREQYKSTKDNTMNDTKGYNYKVYGEIGEKNNDNENSYFPRIHDKFLVPIYSHFNKKEDGNNINDDSYWNLKYRPTYGKIFEGSNKMFQKEMNDFNRRFPSIK